MLLSLARSSIRVGVALGVWMLLACGSATAQAAVEATSGIEGPESAPFGSAQWVAPTGEFRIDRSLPLVRREFTLASRPGKATLRIVGLGDYDVRVNGVRLAQTGINQPWSQYEKTIYYRDFDITPHVRAGANCVGVMLFNSFWHNPNPPAGRYNKEGPQREAAEPLLLRAEIFWEASDGTVQRVGTDADWRATDGPVVFSHIFAGEDFDAGRVAKGWDEPGFDDRAWAKVRIAKAPDASLVPQRWPAFQPYETFDPQFVKEVSPGVYSYIFPQNSSAQLRVELKGGKPGDRIAFRCGEHKNAENRLCGTYDVGCSVVTNGQPLTHQWLSFYLGMQFVEVSGAVPAGAANPQGLPEVVSLQLVHVRTGNPPAGSFTCSRDLFNNTHQMIDWAIRSNSSHVLSDCPHREKLGWLECSYLLAPSFQYRYECRDWFDKILGDIRDAQEPTGRVLTVAPSYPAGRFPGAFNWTVEWGAAAVLLPWKQYVWNGDLQTLQDNYDMMRRFTDCVQQESQDGLAPGGLGDWYDYGHGQPPGPSRFTPTQLSATATWALCALTVSRAAELLGKQDEATRYRALHAQIAADFQRHFRDPATGKLKHLGSPQCANAMALCAEIVPEADRNMLVEDIIADLEARGWQQTAGDVGHVYVIRALAEAGRSDILHQVYGREGTGSYGGILKKGLTSLPETWDAMMDGYQSLNHCMLGHVIEWYYGYVGGIRQKPGTAGWSDVVIAPSIGLLSSCEVSVKTPRGEYVSKWRIEKGAPRTFVLQVQVPQGSSATVVLPSGKSTVVKSGDHEFSETNFGAGDDIDG
jgi:hypothetical protein